MKVKVVRCGTEGRWYEHRIGETFDVHPLDEWLGGMFYQTVENPCPNSRYSESMKPDYMIEECDCEVVE